jgi:hypothetical protein
MSHPGLGAGESFVSERMAAGRGAAANAIDPEILELAEGGGGTQTASAAPSPSGKAAPPSAGPSAKDAPPSQPDLPLGQRFSQFISNAARTAGGVVKQDVTGAWDKLKGDFIESTGLSPEAKKAFQEGSFWDQMKSQFHSTVASGKLPLDAFNMAMSPLTGAIDAGSDAASKAVFSALPEVPGYGQKELRAALNTAAQLMAPAKGKGAPAVAEAPKGGPAEPSAAAKNQGATGNPELSGAGLKPSTAEAPQPFTIAGETAAPGAKLKITQQVRDQAEAFLGGKRGDNPIQVSLEALSNDADLNKTVSDVARMIPKGKVKPDDIRQMNAYSLNLQPDELMARMVPDIPTDEIQARRRHAGQFGRQRNSRRRRGRRWKVPRRKTANSRCAPMPRPTSIIGRFRDAGTDLGRGLRARQAAQDAREVYGKALQQVIADVGPENVDEAIRKAAALPDPKTVSPFVSSLRWMGGRDGLLYGWYNWLLSNPRTLVSNVASNTGASMWNTAVRYAAEKFGTSGDVRPGEAAALLQRLYRIDARRPGGRGQGAEGGQEPVLRRLHHPGRAGDQRHRPSWARRSPTTIPPRARCPICARRCPPAGSARPTISPRWSITGPRRAPCSIATG